MSKLDITYRQIALLGADAHLLAESANPRVAALGNEMQRGYGLAEAMQRLGWRYPREHTKLLLAIDPEAPLRPVLQALAELTAVEADMRRRFLPAMTLFLGMFPACALAVRVVAAFPATNAALHDMLPQYSWHGPLLAGVGGLCIALVLPCCINLLMLTLVPGFSGLEALIDGHRACRLAAAMSPNASAESLQEFAESVRLHDDRLQASLKLPPSIRTARLQGAVADFAASLNDCKAFGQRVFLFLAVFISPFSVFSSRLALTRIEFL